MRRPYRQGDQAYRLVADEILKLGTHRARRPAFADGPVVYFLDVVRGMLAEGLYDGSSCFRRAATRSLPPVVLALELAALASGTALVRTCWGKDEAAYEVQEASMAGLVHLTVLTSMPP